MGSNDEAIAVDALERQLLLSSSTPTGDDNEEEQEKILYAASFDEEEETKRMVRYETAQWVLYSLLLLLAWGIGLLMLLLLPLRIHLSRKQFRSRKLYLTTDAIAYKQSSSTPIINKKESYILLPSVADVVVEQDYLQSFFGLHSVRIEFTGLRRPPSDDLKIHVVPLPTNFLKAVLTQLECIRNEGLLGKRASSSSSSSALPSGDLILQKLDEVEGSLKKVHALIETKGTNISNSPLDGIS
ncbi:12S seed storage globulin 1 [Rhynchospora pubera]|uniref:12S seed storage globulin 1 n=1 Tax=Rhynchospora pubera TaxID=906938 RepID=A0AAV8F8M7_9POAL|nr:12S seed storage globulin 1 [Rhynchospora pubera]